MILPKKAPTETLTIGLEFSAGLDVGETVTSINSVYVTVAAGVDPSPSSILAGSHSLVGSVVLVPVTAGIDRVMYLITALVTTSAGNVLSLTAELPVASDI